MHCTKKWTHSTKAWHWMNEILILHASIILDSKSVIKQYFYLSKQFTEGMCIHNVSLLQLSLEYEWYSLVQIVWGEL